MCNQSMIISSRNYFAKEYMYTVISGQWPPLSNDVYDATGGGFTSQLFHEYIFFFLLKTRSYYVDQAGLKFTEASLPLLSAGIKDMPS